ncbi:MAG: CPBP family intramembrane glutamic endopeptidase [Bacteroidota bacterium]|nr:CPBP family intramembrane glutamic endopeptidase [Bacteroidota bacterium]
MKGLLKTKPPLTQFVILVSIALASFFILGLIGTVILSNVTGMSFEAMSDSSKWDYNSTTLVTMIRGMQVIQFVCLFLIPSFICARLFSTNSTNYLGLKKPSGMAYFLVAVAIMLLALPLVNFLGELNRNVQFPAGIANWMKEQEAEAAKTIKALLSKDSIQDLILNIVCIAGLAAVGEELLFRGVAQRLLIKMFKSPWAGIIITAFIFSAMHVQFYGFLPRFVLGILLGAIYWYSGSLWTAILAHFVYDAFLIVLVYFNPASLNEENALQLSTIAVAAAISLALVIFFVLGMKKKSTVTYQEVYADDAVAVKDHPF